MDTPALANDKYRATLRSTFVDGVDTALAVTAIPTNLPTIVVVGWNTDYETVFRVEGTSGTNASNYSLTGVTKIRGYSGNLPENIAVNCLNVQEFFNQWGEQIAAIQAIAEAAEVYVEDTGTTDEYLVAIPSAPVAYEAGLMISFKAATANTGAATLKVGDLAAVAIKKNHDQDLATNDIEAGQIVSVIYDGTVFQMRSQTASTPSGGSTDGWVDGSAYTWVYASASTFTIAGVDLTTLFQKGTRIRFKQGAGYKYAVVVASSFSTNTTVTIAVNTDYTIANAAITDNYYSYSIKPQGYPSYFTYVPTLTKPTGMTGTPSIQFFVYQIFGTWCHVKGMWSGTFAGTVTGTSWTVSLPVNAISIAGSPRYTGVGYAERTGIALTIIYAYADLANMNLKMYNNAAFLNGDQEYDAEIFYPI